MAKAIRRSPDSFTCRVWDKYKKKQVYFTATTKKEAERQANLYKYTLKEHPQEMTFEEAYDLYIGANSEWSPKTIADYKRWKTTRFSELLSMSLDDMGDEFLQKFFDELCARMKPKSAINVMSPVKATLKRYRPHRRVAISSPKKNKPKVKLPSEGDVKRLLALVADTQYCVPVYLAVFGCMRRGEVASLAMSDINLQTRRIHIHHNKVKNEKKEWVLKSPKNGEDRAITVPKIVIDKIKKYGLPTISNPDDFSNQFGKFVRKNELDMTFHSLRHYCASRMLASGIPISVVQEYGGWKNKTVLLEIYDYVISEIRDESMENWNAISAKLVQEIKKP